MADKTNSKNVVKSATARDDRLKAALKANLARRKAQSRSRAADADDAAAKRNTAGEARQDKDA